MAKTEAQAKKEAQAKFDALESPMTKSVDGKIMEYDATDDAQWIEDETQRILYEANEKWSQDRADNYPSIIEFVEAYTEKEILEDSTKWDAYVTAYEKVRSDHPKPE